MKINIRHKSRLEYISVRVFASSLQQMLTKGQHKEALALVAVSDYQTTFKVLTSYRILRDSGKVHVEYTFFTDSGYDKDIRIYDDYKSMRKDFSHINYPDVVISR